MTTEDIDVIVERYRVRLGLRPWQEWADHMTKVAAKAAAQTGMRYELGRRTGRTQLGILKALALCERRGASVLAIEADPLANLDYCCHMARQSISRLGLRIRVTPDFPGCSRGELAVSYVDHHIHLGKECRS